LYLKIVFADSRKSIATTSTNESLPGSDHDKYTMSYDNDKKENEATMRVNFSGEEKRCDDSGGGSDGGVGGDGAPGRRYAEKGEEKEEVVNVEKPRRNLKRRSIDSNRQLSYSTVADLRGMSKLVDVRRYCPPIPPLLPPFRTHTKALLSSREVSTLAAPYFFSSSYVHTLSSLGGERMRADVWAV